MFGTLAQTHSERIQCPKCDSGDCFDTVSKDVLGPFTLVAHTVICYSCGAYSKMLKVDGKEVVNETNTE